VEALGHDYVPEVTEPTCTEGGYTTYTCSRCGDSYIGDETEALGHDYAAVITEPTCTEGGYTTYTCSRCGDSYTDSETEALGHAWDEGVVTVKPTARAEGEMTFTCTRCGETRTEAIPKLENPFTDVKEDKYYFDAVLWAYYHDPQITGGTGDGTTFSPKANCKREQIITFIWNAYGAPEPETTENPFTDVKESKYYYKAVLWAVENGMTTGATATTFGVGQDCTRAQVMTFLWNAAKQPEPETTENPFTDVKPSSYYYKPVLWAVENGITSGTSATTFSPKKTCTRAEVVTFLFIALGGE
jgi:DNA-directed RNA polymerase subunit RPC12/RpoP